jgi:multidrug resistance efflux pump
VKRAARWATLGVLLAAGAVVARSAAVARAPSARVERGELRERIVARAVVALVDGTAEVRARVDGRALRVLVREGDAVREGDLLAELEADGARAELTRREAERSALAATARAVAEGARPEERAAAEAEVRAAQHDVALQSDRATRLARLRASGSTTEAEFQQAQDGLEVARARLANADARLRLSRAGGRAQDVRAALARVAAADAAVDAARTELARAQIVAPVSGVVLARRVDPGDTVTAASAPAPLFEIGDVTRREVRIEVEDRDAPRIVPALPVVLRVAGGGAELARGSTDRVGARLERRTIGVDDARVRADSRVRVVWVALPASVGPALAIGQPLEAEFDLGVRQVALRVPRGAVAVREGRAVLELPFGPLTRDLPVTLGDADERFVEVRGVALGTRVLVH